MSSLCNNIDDGLLDEAMIAIFPKAEDRKACTELLEAAYDGLSPLHPRPKDGWEQRLKDWYWQQRPKLHYDHSLLRFVPKEENPPK